MRSGCRTDGKRSARSPSAGPTSKLTRNAPAVPRTDARVHAMRSCTAGTGKKRRMSDVEQAATNRAFLREKAYADSKKLRARVSIYAYRDRPDNFWHWVLGLVDWPDLAGALDVGCGPGTYLSLLREEHPLVRAVGVDLSPGMAKEASRHAPVLVGDAARLPIPADAFDRVLAPHMLYHCPDIPAAIAELRRVLRPRGVLVA